VVIINPMSSIPASLSVTHSVAQGLADVQAEIHSASRAVGRSDADVTLVAVSKTHSVDAIQAALTAGQRHFGENRVQEAEEKFPALKQSHPDLVLHLIGPLQTNKAKDAVALFDVIHTLDRPKIAEKLADEMTKQQRRLPCFIQVNTGREPQKAGALPEDVGALVALCREQLSLPVQGFMCIPPADQAPGPHFAFLRELARRHDLAGLSMGMSSDMVAAVRLGSTHVRVGSAIFGSRAMPPDLQS
jgi:PLP dependent protein